MLGPARRFAALRIAAVTSIVTAATLLSAQSPDVRGHVRSWIAANQSAVVRELLDLLALPNVAADRPNIRRNAEHLRGMLSRRGFAVELLETKGNPLVYGELKGASAGPARTVLVYAHYDGQPVDPRGWKQPDPFVPVLRTGHLDRGGEILANAGGQPKYEDDWRIYARSASDDKAPIVALLSALDALKASGRVPAARIRVILDGEEEVSSPNLAAAIAAHREKLRADVMIILDGPAHSSGRATIAFGARGILTFNLTVFGPRAGVHSGNYGNWVPNPAQRLASLLASMKDEDGRVTVAGFDAGVVPPTDAERQQLGALPDDRRAMLDTFGIAAPEVAYPTLQDALVYPTLNVRGLVSAHVGAGARTIIPDRATAAIDVRLVKETRSADLIEKIRAHVQSRGYHLVDGDPSDEIRARHSRIARMEVSPTVTEAFRTSPLDPEGRRMAAALHRFFDEPPVQIRTLGGTVPVSPFIDALDCPAVLVPTVNFDNNQHEENENVRLGHLFRAIEIIAALVVG